MLSDLFDIPESPNSKQKAWLALCSVIPEVKGALDNKVLPEDEKLAKEAKDLLSKSSSS